MDHRIALELDEGRRGTFGKWLFAELAEMSKSLRDNASRMIPQNVSEENERKDMLAQSNILEDLITQIPSKIGEELKKSKTTSNEQ